MSELIQTLERSQVRPVPDFRVGDRARPLPGGRGDPAPDPGLRGRRPEGEGWRSPADVHGAQALVLEGVERTFPVHSPKIERIEVVGRGEVRRAKLYYLRGRVGRRARLREMRDFRPENVGTIGAAAAADEEQAAAEAPAEEAPGGRRRGPRRPPWQPAAEPRLPRPEEPPEAEGRPPLSPRPRGGGPSEPRPELTRRQARSRTSSPARASSRASPLERHSAEAARRRRSQLAARAGGDRGGRDRARAPDPGLSW